MTDYMENTEDSFVLGVVEGFYGRTWTEEQRINLFEFMENLEMNTFMYAPKDDTKHRMCWRQVYSDYEAEKIKFLLDAAHSHKVNFVYAISPGLDINYSDEHDLLCLKKKLEQVANLGCKSFALLFDDIEVEMNANDKERFKTPASAQAYVTNEVYKYLNEPKQFFFCPTEYCSTRAVPNVLSSSYLITIGDELINNIKIFWTGPQVVACNLTETHLDEVASVLKRRPLIWDNFHANDYDQRRIYIGPYSGRESDIVPKLSGVLSNANNQYEANYVPFHTLAKWYKDFKSSVKYDTASALKVAVQEWYKHVCNKRIINFSEVIAERTASYACSDIDSNITDCAQSFVSDNDSGIVDMIPNNLNRSDQQSLLELEEGDLFTFIDYFYTPFSHGGFGLQLLNDLTWLRTNERYLCKNDDKYMDDGCVDEWKNIKNSVVKKIEKAHLQFTRLLNMPNQYVLDDLSTYIREIRLTLSLVKTHVDWLENNKSALPNQPSHLIATNYTWSNPSYRNAFMSGHYEPWMFRGGILAEIQRLLTIDGAADLTVCVSGLHQNELKYDQKHRIVPMTNKKEADKTDKLSNEILKQESLRHSFRVKNEKDDTLAYIVGSPDATKLSNVPRLPNHLASQYPSLISFQILDEFCEKDTTALKRLLATSLATLRQTGARGVYNVFKTDDYNIELYRKLGLAPVFSNDVYTFVARFF